VPIPAYNPDMVPYLVPALSYPDGYCEAQARQEDRVSTRIKLFSSSAQRDLEDQVNAFLAELEAAGGTVIDAQLSAPRLEAGPNHMAVLVIYAPGPVQPSSGAL